MGDYRKLKVWQKAHELTLAVYRETGSFPATERFGLTAQLRRSAVSLASNIAEGSGRQSDGDLRRFLRIARGSLCEVQYQVVLARDLGYLGPSPAADLEAQAGEVGGMLMGLLKHLHRGTTANR